MDLSLSMYRLMRFIPFDKYKEAEQSLDAQKIPFIWLLISYVGFGVYMAFLEWMPHLLEDEAKSETRRVQSKGKGQMKPATARKTATSGSEVKS